MKSIQRPHLRTITSLLLLASFMTSCSGRQARKGDLPSQNPSQKEGSSEMVGPLPPDQQPQIGPEAPLGPQPNADFSPPHEGYVLVLGPGLARGLAYLGVLHEMEQRHLEIKAIIGVEMGAVIGSIWASSNLNSLEWEMHKFNRQTLLDLPLFQLGDKTAEGKRLYKFLGEAIKVNYLQKMKVPVEVVSVAKSGGDELLVESSGSAKDVVRGAMGIPGVLKSYSWEGKERMTAAVESPFPVAQAKALGLGKVVCVDVIGRGDNFSPKEPLEEHLSALMKSVGVIARQQLKECDVVLSIPSDGISYLGFESKADLTYQGKLAVKKWQGGP